MPRAVYDPERDRRIAEQAQRQQQAQEAKEQEQFQQETGEVGPKTVNPLQPIQQALGGIDIGAGLANLIGGQAGVNQYREAVKKDTAKRAKQRAEAEKKAPLAFEAGRTISDIAVGAVEDTLDTADLLGDVAKVGLNKARGLKTKATEDPWSDRYTAAAYNFGIEKPKTEVGQFASKLGKVILITRQLMKSAPKALIGGTKGGPTNWRQAVREGIVPSAVADFITTEPGDGNFSAMVNSFIPETSPLYNSFLTALRTEENDDVFTAKLKGALEGGVVGSVADGLLWMMWGRKAYLAARKTGATKEDGLATALEETQKKMQEIDANHSKYIEKEGEAWTDVRRDELSDLLETEQKITEQLDALRASGIDEADPKFKAAQETLNDVRLHMAEVDEAIVRGYDPDDLKGLSNSDVAAYNKPADPNIAIKQQFKAESPIEGMSRPPVDPFAKDYVPMDGGSYHMMTDAQFKRMSYKPEAEDMIRQFTNKTDLQQMANDLKIPVARLMQHAGEALDNIRNALKSEQPKESFVDLMRSQGMLDPKARDDAMMLSKSGIVVTKALIGDTAEQIHNLATDAIQLRASGGRVGNEFDRLTDRLVTLLEFHKTTAYETGSKLEMFRRRIGAAFNGLDAEDNLELTIKEAREWAVNLKQMIRKGDPAADAEVQRLVNAMVLAGGDPTKQIKFINVFVTQGGRQALIAMYQSILSGPITQFRNNLGNLYSVFERPMSLYLRGVIKDDKVLRDSATAGLHGMVNGVNDAWKIARQTYKTGTSVNFNSKLAIDDFEAQATLKQLMMAANTDSEKIAVGFLNASYRFQNNPWLSWPSRALVAGDDFFKSLGARYRVYSKAKFEALSHSASDADVDTLFDQYIKKFSQGIDPGTGRILDRDLLDYAERATFQQNPTGVFGDSLNYLSKFVDALPLGSGRLFLPFIRTPGNLAGYGLEHLPIANQIIRKMDATYLAAQKSGDRLLMAELEGRSATGLMTISLLTTVALFTDVTGNYPPDPNERKAWQAEGRPPMSIKIGGKWISYASFEPINSFLSVTADIVRLSKMGGADGASRAMHQLFYSITAGYTDKSFLAGLSELGEIFSPKNLSDPSGFRMALNMANNYAPYAGLRRAFSNSVNPYMREVRGEVDRMLVAAAPGYGNDLPAVTSWISGKALNSVGGGLFNAISPIRIQDVNDNFVAKELADIGYPANDLVKRGKYGVDLEPQHREQLAKILFKSGLVDQLEKIMKSPDYKAYKKNYINRPINMETFYNEDENKPLHERKIAEAINSYKRKALDVLMQRDESYRLLVAKKKYSQEQAARGDFTKADIDTIRRYAGIQ